ncbi:hypothetical protein [Cohnella lupini]|uniref:Uncharacterized protein n=1 Tax=Cohnella lupini TaxID=1294267 RepID=A0A3D9I4F5_9BACL|nr:hypothetical protein [Cohnella lupini]RED56624.1 hypothetical protein DFP95_11397 [Cohnella lupini]
MEHVPSAIPSDEKSKTPKEPTLEEIKAIVDKFLRQIGVSSPSLGVDPWEDGERVKALRRPDKER